MPIKNYTTEIDPSRTAGEITRILAAFKARRIQQEFDEKGDLSALSFSIVVDGQELYYRLPARPEGVLKTLKRDAPPRYHTLAHARRVAWRIVKDWIDSQLAMIEAGAAEPQEIFFPYMLVNADETICEAISRRGGFAALASGRLMLTDGKGGGEA
jgi:hypothetical protein